MKTKGSLRLRLIVSFSILLVLVVVVPAWIGVQGVLNLIHEEARKDAVVKVSTASLYLKSEAKNTGFVLNESLRKLARYMQVRITFIGDGGDVLADSQVSANNLSLFDNHSSRPEIIMARQEGVGVDIRFSGSVKTRFVYAAMPLATENGLSGLIRIAIPYSNIEKATRSLANNIIPVLIFSLLVGVGIVFFLVRQITEGINDMVRVAMSIGAGRFDEKIHECPAREFVPLALAINSMAEMIGEDIEKISRQKLEQEAVFNGMSEGVLVLDKKGRILNFNKSMERLFPATPARIGGRPIDVLIAPEVQKACDNMFDRMCSGEASPVSLRIKSLEDLFLLVDIVPISSEANLGAIIVLRDVTVQVRTEEMRRDFVANITHEMRTPLTSITGYAETILDLGQSKEQIDAYVSVILRNAKGMERLLRELLVLARVESAEPMQNMEFLLLRDVVNSAWEYSLSPEEKEKASLEIRGLDLTVWGDKNRLELCFSNFFQNSLKYHSDQPVRVKVWAEEEEESVLIHVEDNGQGIPVAEQKRVFERFYRGRAAREGKNPGTGLGLAICKHVLLRHGGKIVLTSSEEGGVHFSFQLWKSREALSQHLNGILVIKEKTGGDSSPDSEE